MLSECLEVFGSYSDEEREQMIFDNYIFKDGRYLLVGNNGEIKADMTVEAKKEQKEQKGQTNSHYKDFRYFDYYSDLLSMNKPVASKIIHSNNYLSFWIKKESLMNGKLTPEVIDKYYDSFIKQKNGKKKNNYEENELKPINIEFLEQNREWIQKHIFSIQELIDDFDATKKDYLKIFFDSEYSEYLTESRRYMIPRIYNNDSYNIMIQGKVLGLPDNNMGMNDKKPFLAARSRKVVTSYLLDRETAILQKQFFDYLMNCASDRKNNIYVDLRKKDIKFCENEEFLSSIEEGIYLRIKKGKSEVEILDQDNISSYKNELKTPFSLKNLLHIEEKDEEYNDKRTYQELEQIINDIFFQKLLNRYYFTDPKDIKIDDAILKRVILLSRRKLFGWFHLGYTTDIWRTLDKISMELIKNSIACNYTKKAAKQLNLRWSLMQYLKKGGMDMADFSVELREKLKEKLLAEENKGLDNDREYYFAVGQMAYYFVFLSKAGKKKQSLINPFLNARTDEKLKDLLKRYYVKYNYDIPLGARKISRLFTMVEGYRPEGSIMQDMLCTGFVMDNLILEKKNDNSENSINKEED